MICTGGLKCEPKPENESTNQQVHLILTTEYSNMLILLITYDTTHFMK
jgi:hypothetical protein